MATLLLQYFLLFHNMKEMMMNHIWSKKYNVGVSLAIDPMPFRLLIH